MGSDSIAGVNGWIKTKSAVTSVVGGRIYEKYLPQNPTYPALSFWSVVDIPIPNHDDTLKFRDRVQFDCWATSRSSLDSLAGAVRGLHGPIGATFNGIIMEYARYLSSREFEVDYEPEETLKNVRRKIVEFEIWYR